MKEPLVAGLHAIASCLIAWASSSTASAQVDFLKPLRDKGESIEKWGERNGGWRLLPDNDKGPFWWSVQLFSNTVDDPDVALLEKLQGIGVLSIACTTTPKSKVIEWIPKNTELEVLSYAGDLITDQALLKIGDLKKLEILSLCRTRITDGALSHLKTNQKLHTLDLAETSVGDESLKNLAVISLPALRSLSLNKTRVSDQGMKHLAKLKALTRVELCDTAISNDGLKYLSESKSLGGVDLVHTRVTDDGLQHCQLFPRLTELAVSGPGITDRGLKFLENVKGLRELRLPQTKVTKEGLEKLRKALPNCGIRADQLVPPVVCNSVICKYCDVQKIRADRKIAYMPIKGDGHV